jgi:hypothetical protein
MNKILLLMGLSLGLISCEKEVIEKTIVNETIISDTSSCNQDTLMECINANTFGDFTDGYSICNGMIIYQRTFTNNWMSNGDIYYNSLLAPENTNENTKVFLLIENEWVELQYDTYTPLFESQIKYFYFQSFNSFHIIFHYYAIVDFGEGPFITQAPDEELYIKIVNVE